MIAEPAIKEDFSSEKIREVFTRSFFELTEHWELSRQEEAKLLGWDYDEKRTAIDSLRKGKTIISKDQDKIERIIDLVNIHKSLRILFPSDRNAVYGWIKVKRERFGGFSALDVMLEDGKEGISAIRRYLDHERTR